MIRLAPLVALALAATPGHPSAPPATSQAVRAAQPADTEPASDARALAQSALASAQHAVAAAPPSPQRDRAASKVAEADRLFHQARYQEAADTADAAWALLGDTEGATRFEVQVAEDGTTRVRARTGRPVRVRDPDGLIALLPGEEATASPGAPPRKIAALPAPLLERPRPHQRLTFQHGPRLGPVRLSWKSVQGAVRYAVEVDSAKGHVSSLKVETAFATLPPLPPGTYTWSVRAVGHTGASARSRTRSFQLALPKLRLDAERTKWK